jgi:hypothetical protein
VNPTSARRGNWVLDADGRSSLLQLFIVSFASLYIEVMLIRWIGTEFRLFAYIQNLTLVACFLGFGLGCLRSSLKPRYLFNFEALAFIVMIIEVPWPNWKGFLDIVVGELSQPARTCRCGRLRKLPTRPYLLFWLAPPW